MGGKMTTAYEKELAEFLERLKGEVPTTERAFMAGWLAYANAQLSKRIRVEMGG
jgi:hypothetical protein